VTKSKSPIRRHITRSPSSKTSNSPPRVIAVKAPVVSAAQGNMSYLYDFEELNGGYVSFGGNPKGGKITVKGKIKTGKLDVDDVYFVKELKFNIFSVSQMCDKKNSVLFTDTECLVLSPDFQLPDESQVLLRVPRENNMYNVNLKNIFPSRDLTCLFAKAMIDESNLWHRRLAHLNFKTINKLVKVNLVRGLPTKVFENDNTCVACKKGKQHRAFCKTKPDETSPILKTFITSLENQPSLKVKVIRSDNGAEFKNHNLNQLCGIKGIKKGIQCTKTPQQNGIAERKNRTLIEAARMLADSLLPISFWAEAVNTACYIQNRVLVTKPYNKTLYELLHGRTPSIGFMRPFGCPVTILNTLDFLEKFEGKVDEGFLEHDFDAKKPESEVNVSPSSNLSREFKDCSNNSTNEVNAAGSIVHTVGQNSFNNTNTFSVAGPSNAAVSPTYGKSSFIDAFQLLVDLDMPELEDIIYSDDKDVVGAEADFNNLESSIPEEPKRVHQALKDPSWIKAMQEELLQFKMQKVWVLVNLPYEKRAIGTKRMKEALWLGTKQDLSYKDIQEEGIDYKEVFAPVARIEAIRLFLAYASFMDFMMYQMDVKSAFLYETIEEEVYFCQPLGFEDHDHPDKVYKVVKALYGLHQDPKAWYETLATYLLENGFQRGKIDQTLFIKSQDKYAAEILRKFGLTDGKSSSTPIDTEKPILKDPNGEDVDVHTYRSMIGSLMYLTSSRPDIMFAQIVVATSSTEAEYVVAASCYAQVLWIQN
nr:hypothetical protein [Tanacetum cinerariifolium]